MSVLALDLGGTKLAAALFTPSGEMLESTSASLDGRTGEDAGKFVIDQIGRFDVQKIKAIGVSIPGIYRHNSGTVWAPNIDGWEDFPLLRVIQSAYSSATVAIDSDRACSMMGELWRGAAQGSSDVVFIAVGTGIGAGILSGGNIIRGAGDIAGATGWMALKKPFHSKYVPCGCFEYYASGAGMARYSEELLIEDKEYSGSLRPLQGRVTARDIFQSHASGDVLASRVIEECIKLWGMAAANFVSIFNPAKVIFGGGIFGPAVKFIPDIYNEALKWAQPISIRQVTFEPSALGPQAALYGAGYFASQNIKTSRR